MGKYIACICEGGAERAILDLLLDSDKLIFQRKDLIEEDVLRCRSGKEFESRYLRKGFSEKVTIYRILDSRGERFNLSRAYEHKVDVKNVVTAPEIEKLIICNEGKYSDFEKETRKNPRLKPSSYCKSFLNHKNVKSYDFVKDYFSDIQVLVRALHEYRRISKIRGNEMTIWDLLKK